MTSFSSNPPLPASGSDIAGPERACISLSQGEQANGNKQQVNWGDEVLVVLSRENSTNSERKPRN